jgi:hypothetical protein
MKQLALLFPELFLSAAALIANHPIEKQPVAAPHRYPQ